MTPDIDALARRIVAVLRDAPLYPAPLAPESQALTAWACELLAEGSDYPTVLETASAEFVAARLRELIAPLQAEIARLKEEREKLINARIGYQEPYTLPGGHQVSADWQAVMIQHKYLPVRVGVHSEYFPTREQAVAAILKNAGITPTPERSPDE